MLDLGHALLLSIQLIGGLDPELFGIIALSLRVSLFATAIAFVIGAALGTALAVLAFPAARPPSFSSTPSSDCPRGRGAPSTSCCPGRACSARSGTLAERHGDRAGRAGVADRRRPDPSGPRCPLARVRRRAADGRSLPWARRPRTAAHRARCLAHAAFLAAFGRAIAEVGAILVVGGNIRGTRTMTTTIALEASRGDPGPRFGARDDLDRRRGQRRRLRAQQARRAKLRPIRPLVFASAAFPSGTSRWERQPS